MESAVTNSSFSVHLNPQIRYAGGVLGQAICCTEYGYYDCPDCEITRLNLNNGRDFDGCRRQCQVGLWIDSILILYHFMQHCSSPSD